MYCLVTSIFCKKTNYNRKIILQNIYQYKILINTQFANRIGTKIGNVNLNIYSKKLGIFIPFCSATAFTIKLGALPKYVQAPNITEATDITTTWENTLLSIILIISLGKLISNPTLPIEAESAVR